MNIYIYIYIVLNNLPSQVQSQVQTHEQVSGTLRKTCSHQKLSSASIDSFRSELLRPLWSCQDGWNAHVSIAKDVDIYIYVYLYSNLQVQVQSQVQTHVQVSGTPKVKHAATKTCPQPHAHLSAQPLYDPAKMMVAIDMFLVESSLKTVLLFLR